MHRSVAGTCKAQAAEGETHTKTSRTLLLYTLLKTFERKTRGMIYITWPLLRLPLLLLPLSLRRVMGR